MPGVSKNCPQCGATFSCGAGAGGCWCEACPALEPVEGTDCLCPECLRLATAAPQTGRSLMEGDDYYLEGTAVVFTAAYHRRRGYCCGNGCRHCPYGHQAVSG